MKKSLHTTFYISHTSPAFTLIEIIIVTAIIIILTAAAITGASGVVKTLRFNNTFDKVVFMLQKTRSIAIAERKNEPYYQFMIETQHPPYFTQIRTWNEVIEQFEVDPLPGQDYELIVTDLTSGLPCPHITEINFDPKTGKMSINCPGIPQVDEAKLIEFRLREFPFISGKSREKIFLIHRAVGIPQVL